MNLTFIRTYIHHTDRRTHRNSSRNNNLTPTKNSSPRRNFPAHFVFRFSFDHSVKITATSCHPSSYCIKAEGFSFHLPQRVARNA